MKLSVMNRWHLKTTRGKKVLTSSSSNLQQRITQSYESNVFELKKQTHGLEKFSDLIAVDLAVAK